MISHCTHIIKCLTASTLSKDYLTSSPTTIHQYCTITKYTTLIPTTTSQAAMDFKGNIVFDTSKSDGQYKKTASNKKLRALYPEFKFTSIEEVIYSPSSLICLLDILTLE